MERTLRRAEFRPVCIQARDNQLAAEIGHFVDQEACSIPIEFRRRVIQQQIARADNFFFGSEPWISVAPMGSDDKQLANSIDRWVKDRFHKAGTIQAHKQANEGAFIRGEDVI